MKLISYGILAALTSGAASSDLLNAMPETLLLAVWGGVLLVVARSVRQRTHASIEVPVVARTTARLHTARELEANA